MLISELKKLTQACDDNDSVYFVDAEGNMFDVAGGLVETRKTEDASGNPVIAYDLVLSSGEELEP